MRINVFLVLLTGLIFLGCQHPFQENNPPREPVSVKTDEFKLEGSLNTPADSILVIPIEHQSFVLKFMGKVILVDPVGDLRKYREFSRPDMLLITGTHPTHETLSLMKELVLKNTALVVPQAVKNTLSSNLNKKATVLKPNEMSTFQGIEMEVLFDKPNQKEQSGKFLEENAGYLLGRKGKTVFISGETGDITKLKNRRDIDLAFVGMDFNSQKTMTRMIDALARLAPKYVYPYYYRGPEVYSEVAKLKKALEKNEPPIQVEVLNWYPMQEELLL